MTARPIARSRTRKNNPDKKSVARIVILLIDNYDSFTYNLVQRLGELDPDVDLRVVRNDQVTPDEVAALKPSHLIISPGPCTPREAGVSNELIRRFAATVPTLGVCLGHQCIGHVFGGEVVRNERVMHGKTSPIYHDGQGVFRGLSDPFEATRYHSLVIRRETFRNPDFVIGAWTAEGEIMGVRHKTWPLHGVQFHPESFLTEEGPKLLRNFVEMKA
jgi:anthranilate synthase/aminodeoxychorismate synthase-like glutamine amidotransferase